MPEAVGKLKVRSDKGRALVRINSRTNARPSSLRTNASRTVPTSAVSVR